MVGLEGTVPESRRSCAVALQQERFPRVSSMVPLGRGDNRVLKNSLSCIIWSYLQKIIFFFFLQSSSVVVSYSVNSVVFTHFYVSCRLKPQGYDSAAAGVAGSRPAESTQVLCLVEMSCNAWGTWRGRLHMQSYSIPFLLFLPLFSSPSVQLSTLLSRRPPASHFQTSKVARTVTVRP